MNNTIENKENTHNIMTYSEYLGKHIDCMIDPKATLIIFEEKIVNGKRVCLVKKSRYCVDIFYKNGKSKSTMIFETYNDAELTYNYNLKIN